MKSDAKTKGRLLTELIIGALITCIAFACAVRIIPTSENPIIGIAMGVGIALMLNSIKIFFKQLSAKINDEKVK